MKLVNNFESGKKKGKNFFKHLILNLVDASDFAECVVSCLCVNSWVIFLNITIIIFFHSLVGFSFTFFTVFNDSVCSLLS